MVPKVNVLGADIRNDIFADTTKNTGRPGKVFCNIFLDK